MRVSICLVVIDRLDVEAIILVVQTCDNLHNNKSLCHSDNRIGFSDKIYPGNCCPIVIMVISLEDTRRLSKTTKRWHGVAGGGMLVAGVIFHFLIRGGIKSGHFFRPVLKIKN